MIATVRNLMVGTIILASPSLAMAQGVPCFTAQACGQIRQYQQQEAAAQAAAAAAQQAAYVQQQRNAAKAAEAARAQRAIAQAAADRQQALEIATAEAAQRQAAQDRADAEARAEAQREAAAAQAKLDAENRAAAQLAAENSPDNHCKEPKIAGELIHSFNDFENVQDNNVQSVDIEHLTTIKFNVVDGKDVFACHGDFVLMNGHRLPGIMSTRINVAGNIIVYFKAD